MNLPLTIACPVCEEKFFHFERLSSHLSFLHPDKPLDNSQSPKGE